MYCNVLKMFDTRYIDVSVITLPCKLVGDSLLFNSCSAFLSVSIVISALPKSNAFVLFPLSTSASKFESAILYVMLIA